MAMSSWVRCAALCALLSGCAAGADPRRDGSFGDGGMDAGMADAGGFVPDDAGRDSGAPDEVGLCEACIIHEQCGSLGRCVRLTDGEFACTAVCNPDIPSCPRGFECVIRVESPGFPVCVPVGERCCVDEDADGFGLGVGCIGPDCDDANITRNPAAQEVCDGNDSDCDGRVDEDSVDCGVQRCVGAGELFEEFPPGSCMAGSCSDTGARSCVLYTCEQGGEDGDHCATTCLRAGEEDDGLCISDAHCDLGVCEEDVENGEECDEDTDCESMHCDNGFCCDDGACCASDTDCPGAGGVGTTCDDSASCQGSRGEIVCETFQCTTRLGIADDRQCTTSVEADNCGAYLSVFCDGTVDQRSPRCPSSCSNDSACDADAHCDVACVPDQVDGSVCDEDSDCISGHCTNNVCCATGDCCQNAEDCPSRYSTSPTCDLPSACQGTRDAAICADFMCDTAEDVADDSACTVSIEAQACGLYPSRFCSGGTDQTPPLCAMGCTADAECDSNAHCDGMACLMDLPNGTMCDEPSDCVSNHCQNGYCCGGGDCCSRDTDCSPGTYGEAPRCLSPAMCQGERRDPICNASNQCQLGPAVGDDSGCVGQLSNTCALFPSVFCTSAQSQTTDQGGLCDMQCSASSECDAGAYCMGTTCAPSGMMGEACTATAQCATGLSCVDGVCCSSSCTGTCVACNVPGHLGTCWNVPNNTDPAGECGGFSCSAYYWGWAGSLNDQCYRRLDASSANVFCEGDGTCQDPADVCPGQPQGSLATNCNDTCQTENTSTCTGTTAGTCNNSPAGTQTCGTGACFVSTARCDNGLPVACTPGTPRAEACDDIDNNCNGVVDDGLSGDGLEPNNNCTQTTYLGQLNTIGAGSSTTVTPTIYGTGDVDVFRANWRENDNTCGCGTSTDEDYSLTATLTVPVGAGSYRICSASGGTCTTGTNCTTVAAGATGSVTMWFDGDCCPNVWPFDGCFNSGTGWFTISGVGAPANECRAYTLTVNTGIGCR
jgi:hypothetical protein